MTERGGTEVRRIYNEYYRQNRPPLAMERAFSRFPKRFLDGSTRPLPLIQGFPERVVYKGYGWVSKEDMDKARTLGEILPHLHPPPKTKTSYQKC